MTGAVVCWGANRAGALGDGSATARPSPVAVLGLTDAVGLSLGEAFTCARRASGAVVCWGDNELGQLGDGSRNARAAPSLALAVFGLP